MPEIDSHFFGVNRISDAFDESSHLGALSNYAGYLFNPAELVEVQRQFKKLQQQIYFSKTPHNLDGDYACD